MLRSSVTRRWTPEEEAFLTQLLEEGKDYPLIALQLKRSIAAVQTHASLLRARSAFRAGPKADGS
jgi:DNA-binding NarL/FixJ family response regulator